MIAIISDMTIGMTIDGMLRKIGKTQSWLATELGVSRSTVWRICSGRINPGDELISQISKIFLREGINSNKNNIVGVCDFNMLITLSTLKKIMGNPNTSSDAKKKIGIVINMISAM
ncbi:MAG: helix-turn-helix transcriptional regulator [Caldisericia bacterium]